MSFSEQKMYERLATLTSARDSIETISKWIIHHYKSNIGDTIVNVWLKEVSREQSAKRVVNLMWLANDVIQNSRRKDPEIGKRFYTVMENAFKHAKKKTQNDELMTCMVRLIAVWRERSIYTKEQLHKLEMVISMKKSVSREALPVMDIPICRNTFDDAKMEHLEKQTKEMRAILRSLEDASSCNQQIRQKIAAFPETIANPSFLSQVKNEADATVILNETKEAEPIVKDYCQALANEVLDRRNLQNLLTELGETLKIVATRNAALIEEMERREDDARKSLLEVEHAYDSLPDLNELGFDTHLPLPTLGELFND